MNKNSITKIAKKAVPAAMILVPFLVFAALPVPTPPTAGGGLTLTEVQLRIEQIARFLIVVSVIIAVIAIIWAGILWATAGGSDDRKGKAKKWFYNGVIGALIILAVGVILQTLAGLVARTLFG